MMKFRKFSSAVLKLFFFTSLIPLGIGFGISYALSSVFEINALASILIGSLIWAMLLLFAGRRFVAVVLKPVESLYVSLDHLATGPGTQPPPDANKHGVGKEIVEQILKDIYDLSSGATERNTQIESVKQLLESIIDMQSSAIVALDRNQQVIFANDSATRLLPETLERATGRLFDEVFSLEFQVEQTLGDWIAESQKEGVSTRQMWEKVRASNGPLPLNYYDLIADYRPELPVGIETILVLIDKTESYGEEIDKVNFTAMAAHELRSPIGLLRGYIEVFEDELSPKLDDEQRVLMQRMNFAAARLSTFISNLLNASKIENGELSLKLREDTVYDCVNAYIEEFKMRVGVHNQKLIYEADDHLPSVGIDRVAIYEVLSNLLDNAIKYNRPEADIIIKARKSTTGGATITVQDFGIGIPNSSMENLFERFYRSHHSRKQVSGNGIGLFISKRIIEAHGGTIWVNSTKGEGSTFGFDLPAYKDLGEARKAVDDGGTIVRTAHGWIKNHGKVRR